MMTKLKACVYLSPQIDLRRWQTCTTKTCDVALIWHCSFE